MLFPPRSDGFLMTGSLNSLGTASVSAHRIVKFGKTSEAETVTAALPHSPLNPVSRYHIHTVFEHFHHCFHHFSGQFGSIPGHSFLIFFFVMKKFFQIQNFPKLCLVQLDAISSSCCLGRRET